MSLNRLWDKLQIARYSALEDKVFKQIKSMAKLATNFYIDNKGASIIGSFLRDETNLVAREVPFLKCPYEAAFIEIDLYEVYKWHKRMAEHFRSSSQHMGFLIIKDLVFTMSATDDVDDFMVSSLLLSLTTPEIEDIRKEVTDKLTWSWGLEDRLDANLKTIVSRHCSYRDIPIKTPIPAYYENGKTVSEEDFFLINAAFLEGANAVLFAILAFLSRPNVTKLSQQTLGTRTFSRGRSIKTRPFIVIDIYKEPKTLFRQKDNAKGLPPGYEVLRRRGSWVRNRQAIENQIAGCQHDWKESDSLEAKI